MKGPATTDNKKNLRTRAEEQLKQGPEAVGELSDIDWRCLAHELQVHQIELEMQNEELRNAHHELEAAKSRYFDLYDLAPIGYLTFSSTGLVIEANLAAANMLLVSRQSLLMQPIDRYIFVKDQGRYYQHRKKCFESCNPFVWEMRMIRGDGSQFWVRFQANPAKNGELWITMNDINREKQAEDKLKELNDSLEESLAQSLDDMRQKDQLLIMQERRAEMGEMVNNIAHQWRQPLNSLGLYLQDLPYAYDAKEIDMGHIRSNIDNSMQLIQYMSQTINDFTDFFKADKKVTTFSVNKIIRRTLSLMEKSFQEYQIRIFFQEEGDPVINGYPNEYAQTLLNIFANARYALIDKHTEEPLIAIRSFVEGTKTIVTVTDNAGGIAEEVLESLFNPYVTTKGSDKGTGIGLFMSKCIIEKNMGGRLTACNTGNGAEFRIEI